MLPLHNNVLPLDGMAEYWSREIGGLRTPDEIYHELLAAFWRDELDMFRNNESNIVHPVDFLRSIALKREHPGFVLIDSPEVIPPKLTEHADGGVTVDMQIYIILPNDQTCWTDEIVRAACDELAKLRLEDYHDLFKPSVRLFRTTRQSMAAYCNAMGYERPRFWFPKERASQWTVRREREFTAWFKQIAGSPKRKSKAQYFAEASQEFPGLPRKAFNRIWGANAPPGWKRSGPVFRRNQSRTHP